MSVEILQAREDLMESIQTFLKKFNRISFRETPKVLLLAWEFFFDIKHACKEKQHQPEDIQELLRKLLIDVQIISEELADFINTPNWNRPAFCYDDDDDDDEEYTFTITPVLPTMEPNNSLSRIPNLFDRVSQLILQSLIPYPQRGIPRSLLALVGYHYIQGERPEKDPGSLACIKADEKKLDDIRIVRDFSEVFPDDLSGLPPVRELEFASI
ncbi:hypothetical protein Tco_1177051 [Tanacetum coccineum]